MYQSSNFKTGPSYVPKVIKITIGMTLILTFLSLFSHNLFVQVLHFPSLQQLLSLSLWGIHHFFIWQFISYLFVQPLTSGISFGLLLHIFFQLYLLWAIGSSIVAMKGRNHFLALYFGGGFFVGLISYLTQFLVGISIPFSGATASIYILLIGWCFLCPNASLMLFMMIPMRAKWLVFGFIGVNLFLDFSNGNFFGFICLLSSLIFGYLYPLLVWEHLSPFPRLHSFEKRLIYFKQRFNHSKYFRRNHSILEEGKIYDFKTGKALMNEDQFIDQCLEKISRYGKKSLTFFERFKLYRLSKKRKLKK